MRTELTAEQIESYRTNGFVALPELLDSEELGAWRDSVDEALRERDDAGQGAWAGPDRDELELTDDYKRMFVQRLHLWQTNERVRALVLDPRLGRLVAELEGVEAMRIWQDQALVKQPYATPTGWHQDEPIFAFTSEHCISL